MIDLAEKITDKMPTTADPPSKPYYPSSLRLKEDQLKDLGLDECKLGDTYTLTIKVKASNLSDTGSTFDIISAEKAEEAEDEDQEDEPKEEKKKPQTVPPSKARILRPPRDYDED